jgi:hypothetical protein
MSVGGSHEVLGSTQTSGRQNISVLVVTDTEISDAVINNQSCGYYGYFEITAGADWVDFEFYGAVIEYTYTSP